MKQPYTLEEIYNITKEHLISKGYKVETNAINESYLSLTLEIKAGRSRSKCYIGVSNTNTVLFSLVKKYKIPADKTDEIERFSDIVGFVDFLGNRKMIVGGDLEGEWLSFLCQYYIECDVIFKNPDIISETVEELKEKITAFKNSVFYITEGKGTAEEAYAKFYK